MIAEDYIVARAAINGVGVTRTAGRYHEHGVDLVEPGCRIEAADLILREQQQIDIEV